MDEQTLVEEALKLIAEGRPLPEKLANKLPPALLQRLLALVEQLRAEGLAGPHNRTPQRILAMQKIINRWLQLQGELTPDQAAKTVPGQTDVESLHIRQANAQTAMDQRRMLGELRR